MNDQKKLILAGSLFLLAIVVLASFRDRSWEGPAPIIQAVATNDVDAARQAVQRSWHVVREVDLDGNTPLHIAAEHGNPEMVDLLLTAGADPNHVNREGFTPLGYSLLSESGSKPQVVEALLTAGARSDVPLPEGTSLDAALQAHQQSLASR